MHKKEFTAKVKEMLKEHHAATLKECIRLFDSGGVDTKSYESNYLLPKMIMSVALQNKAHQYNPPASMKDLVKDAKNLQRF